MTGGPAVRAGKGSAPVTSAWSRRVAGPRSRRDRGRAARSRRRGAWAARRSALARGRTSEWMPRKRAARRSVIACRASSGRCGRARDLPRRVRADGQRGQVEWPQRVADLLEVGSRRIAREVESLRSEHRPRGPERRPWSTSVRPGPMLGGVQTMRTPSTSRTRPSRAPRHSRFRGRPATI